MYKIIKYILVCLKCRVIKSLSSTRKTQASIRLKTAKRKTQVSRQRVRSAIAAVKKGDTDPVITITEEGRTIYCKDSQYQN